MYIKNLLNLTFNSNKIHSKIIELFLELNKASNQNFNEVNAKYFNSHNLSYLSFLKRKKHIVYLQLKFLDDIKSSYVIQYNLKDDSYYIDMHYIKQFNKFYDKKYNYVVCFNDANKFLKD